MKKFYWLLALPYVVVATTNTYIGMYGPRDVVSFRVGTMQCPGTQKECEDLAAALNQAHEIRHPKRIETIKAKPCPCTIGGENSCLCNSDSTMEIEMIDKYHAKPFNYKSACGQEDCGEEAK